MDREMKTTRTYTILLEYRTRDGGSVREVSQGVNTTIERAVSTAIAGLIIAEVILRVEDVLSIHAFEGVPGTV
jgi:hypothetical protein